MKVKCVNASNVRLTLDKVYEVLYNGKEDYQVRDDEGAELCFLKRRFEVVDDATQLPAPSPTPTQVVAPIEPPFDFNAYNSTLPGGVRLRRY